MRDRYLENSLKQGTREAGGTGTRRRVYYNAAIPLKWKSFLRLDDSKALRVSCSEGSIPQTIPNLEVISTAALDVISSTTIDKGAWHLATIRQSMPL